MAIQLKTLSGAPAGFPIVVTTQALGGDDVQITFHAVGRTLRVWHPIYMKRLADEGNLAAEAAAKAKAAEAPAAEGEQATTPAIVYDEAEVLANLDKALQRGASLVREVATGWSLDAEFTDENIMALIEQYPGVQQELHTLYHKAILGNRVKN